jgi:para-nitrobenzyl esterase
MRTIAAVCVLAACAPRPPPITNAPPAAPELVRVETGLVRGHAAGATYAWKGIPYAAPPLGELRWRPPQRAAAWPGVRDATGFGAPCMQAGTSSDPGATAMGSEDCLTLNVWRPAASAGPLPVMVFVHGGYFTWGTSSYRKQGVDLYDGAHLATAADVVVVTLNYRIGPFGFLAHPALAAEDPHHTTGDYGLLDQIAALGWVQRNIAAFGGDPRNVTLFGQSAGAISSAALYASPLARGLFERVILHSGNGHAMPLASAERTGAALAQRLDCATLACLRTRSASAIATAVPESFAPGGIKYGPVVDGYVLTASPLELAERGEQAHVPLLVASTADEFSTMVQNYLDGPLGTPDDYARQLARRFGPALAPRLLAQYPASAYPTPLAAYTAVWTDAAFACGSDWLADAAAAHQREPVYRFVYAHTYAHGPLAKLGAGHGLDLYLVFRNTPVYLPLDASERALSDQLIAVWSRFAHTGDPGWPARTPTGGEQTVLDTRIHAAAAVTNARCALWRDVTRPGR